MYVALLLSLCLHASLIIAPAWQTVGLRPTPTPSIEATLLAPTAARELVETVSSVAPEGLPTLQPVPPGSLRAGPLRRAKAAFSEHLFYPTEAVARGLEGEVILLLTLAPNGTLAGAEIARSSGHALLDQAALDAAQRVGALPGNPRQILFPVSFRLR